MTAISSNRADKKAEKLLEREIARKKRKLQKTTAFDVFNIIFLLILAFIVIVPFYYTIVRSFLTQQEFIMNGTTLWPQSPTTGNYRDIFVGTGLLRSFFNSVLYTVTGTIFSMFLATTLAYGLSKKNYPGRALFQNMIVFTMYFGGGLVPTYLIVKQTGLLGSMWALFLPGVVAVGNVIIVRNFFENNIPRELLVAAEIDGASKWTVFVKMVIPLSRSIMAVMVVYSMVAYWNDWFTALIYLRADQAPLPLVLRNILIKSSTSASQSSMVAGGFAELNKLTEMIKFASIIVAAAPMLIVYPFVQKYFEKGFMAGAVKG